MFTLKYVSYRDPTGLLANANTMEAGGIELIAIGYKYATEDQLVMMGEEVIYFINSCMNIKKLKHSLLNEAAWLITYR